MGENSYMQLKKIGLCVLLSASCLMKTQFAFAVPDDGTDDVETVAITGQSQDAIGDMLLQSISLMGIPYRWGGNTPQTGMDCSGFIRYVFQKSLGITLPRTAAEMAKVGKRVSLDELEPGDLIFFSERRGGRMIIGHVGMYIGNNKFIQSPHTGDSIKISELNSSYRAKISGAKRIVQENQDDSGKTTVESFQDVHNEALPVFGGYSKPARRAIGHKHAAGGKKVTHRHSTSPKTKHSNKRKSRKHSG